MNNWKEKIFGIFSKYSKRSGGLFCGTCKRRKKERFCKYCKKETQDNYVVKVPTLKIKATFNKASFLIKCGEESFNY